MKLNYQMTSSLSLPILLNILVTPINTRLKNLHITQDLRKYLKTILMFLKKSKAWISTSKDGRQ